ncbi:sigma-E factor negative regulatory protein [Massilia sp. CF038]|uniref:sigma-E factor negative regulatory protein n=1 Tax=Massilia sp. CF038 TaxID=1881045 RepID=UPI00091FEBF2|nr:sigma-E factor negative regulatory protein [Massilia sp. CF038]SHG60495.1 sigma-E factor negative regulatory protein RseA [Massilia sp. CF038]
MDTHKKIREHISTLSDGELSSADLELALAALQSADGQQAWNTYHRIGDVLRAQATAELSDGFAERLAARLASEAPPLRRAARAAAAAAPDKRRLDAGDAAGMAAAPRSASGADEGSVEALAVTAAKPAIVSVS